MIILFTDQELAAYAEGCLSDEETRAIEKKAVETGQTDLLLSVIIAQAAVDRDLAAEFWGDDYSGELWNSEPSPMRVAACMSEGFFKKNIE